MKKLCLSLILMCASLARADSDISKNLSSLNARLPHVANNAALLSSTPASVGPLAAIVRDGFNSAGDGGQALYVHTASACSIASGDGDNGGQVKASDGGCWNLSQQPYYNLAIWGALTSTVNNGPPINAAFNWAAKVGGGADFKLGAGTYAVASTFDCHYLSGWTLEGAGNGATVLYRVGNYGHTFTCGGSTKFTQNLTIRGIWFDQDIGKSPTTAFRNGTTGFGTGYDAAGSGHIVLRNVSHVKIDHVAAWNMNFNIELIDDIDVDIDNPQLTGFWDGKNDQTKANIYIDGADGEFSNGHPQLIHIHNLLTNGYSTQASRMFGSGWTANTVPSFNVEKGAYDDVLVKSGEGVTLDGGNALIGAYHANIELRPQGLAGKPILQFRSNDVWYDGAGTANVYIDNSDTLACTNPNVTASDVQFIGGLFNGELATQNAVSVPRNSCNSVIGLQIIGTQAFAHLGSTYYLGGVSAGNILGGSARNYNVYGYNFAHAANASAVWLFGGTTNFSITGLQAGGDNSFGGPATAVGVATVASGGTSWAAHAAGTLTWVGGNCSTAPVVDVSTNASGVIHTTGIATAGSCQRWPSVHSTAWKSSTNLGSGIAVSLALGPAYSVANQTQYGVSSEADLRNIKRVGIQNLGYYQDFGARQLSCSIGSGAPIYEQGSDSRQVVVTTTADSGRVTNGTCSFDGMLSTFANVKVTATDALTSANVPVAAAITTVNSDGFAFATASSIGGGGKITFSIDDRD